MHVPQSFLLSCSLALAGVGGRGRCCCSDNIRVLLSFLSLSSSFSTAFRHLGFVLVRFKWFLVPDSTTLLPFVFCAPPRQLCFYDFCVPPRLLFRTSTPFFESEIVIAGHHHRLSSTSSLRPSSSPLVIAVWVHHRPRVHPQVRHHRPSSPSGIIFQVRRHRCPRSPTETVILVVGSPTVEHHLCHPC